MRWDTRTGMTRARRLLKQVRTVKTWQLIILLLLGMLLSASLLRLNNLGMDERRTAVIKADEAGDVAVLRTSVVELQQYVSSHMNAGLGNGFYLVNSYQRDRDAALAAANSQTNPNSSVYQQASVECRSRFQGGVQSFQNDYVQCVIERVSALSPQAGQDAEKNLPKTDSYKINFVSPLWTPDFAGISVAFCVLIIVIIAGRWALLLWLRMLVRRHYRGL